MSRRRWTVFRKKDPPAKEKRLPNAPDRPCTGGGKSEMFCALCLRLGDEQDTSNSN
jgi:hypothetical protein